MVQGFRATVLNFRGNRLVPVRLLESSRTSDDAWRLYARSASSLTTVLSSCPTRGSSATRLRCLEGPRAQATHAETKRRVEMSTLSSLVQETVGTAEPSVIMIDWVHYRGGYIITGFNATTSKICIYEWIRSPRAADVEAWVSLHIRVDNALLPDRLDSSASLNRCTASPRQFTKLAHPETF